MMTFKTLPLVYYAIESSSIITDIHLLLGPLALMAKGSGCLITASAGDLQTERGACRAVN